MQTAGRQWLLIGAVCALAFGSGRFLGRIQVQNDLTIARRQYDDAIRVIGDLARIQSQLEGKVQELEHPPRPQLSTPAPSP
jgi:hypothetical protein